MASAYSNGFGPSAGYGYTPRRPGGNNDIAAQCQLVLAGIKRTIRRIILTLRANGFGTIGIMLSRAVWQVKMNLTARRVFSFPHLLVCLWVLILLWGEYWVFGTNIGKCDWDHWEHWPAGSTPHRLVFIADPQIIDPHTYPDRGWPLSELTVLITDNYLRKAHAQLQTQLQPDSVFFLGDLFDGGREWKTASGDFRDPKWAESLRPQKERKFAKMWKKKYGERFWLQEYTRFGDLFFKDWSLGGDRAGSWQRGRKLVASVPGNHDLGFGDEIKVPVRDRFSAFFGEGNRVDVVGNHTIVSVDTVSLSAEASDMAGRVDLKPIHTPADAFLENVKTTKRKAVERELRFWRGEVEELTFDHVVEDIKKAKVDGLPSLTSGKAPFDFPTILLTHVPLYRDPGTPCGPLREHWPPSPRPAGQKEPVKPDDRNAIHVSKGYQYQNVLNEDVSIKLIKSIGNVVHVFSGDDHDYCEVVHSEKKEGVREITVKSMSMAMGVPTPGFLMVSLWNPVDGNGNHIPGAPEQTLQTHLCLLPNQIATYQTYLILVALCTAAIIVRAILMPVFHLTPFTLAAEPTAPPPILPTYKDKKEDDGTYLMRSTSATSGSSKYLSSRFSDSRTRSGSLPTDGASGSSSASSVRTGRSGKHHGKKWGWGENNRGPRIDIFKDELYAGVTTADRPQDMWRAASGRPRGAMGLVIREIVSSVWRVAWLTTLLWVYFIYKG